jgi:hypothetical protein
MAQAHAPQIVFENDFEDDPVTNVPRFDLEAYARATAQGSARTDDVGQLSAFRASFPTMPAEVGALVNEPEEDTLLRLLGGGDRELRVCVAMSVVTAHNLDPAQGYILGLLDGGTSITDVVDISALPRLQTLRTIESLAQLGIVS